VPEIRILHMATPSPYTRFGQKGIGEGGAIAPPAAIANAVNDALRELGAELLVSPITPRRIVEAIRRAPAIPEAEPKGRLSGTSGDESNLASRGPGLERGSPPARIAPSGMTGASE
jgi:hypothetical protein